MKRKRLRPNCLRKFACREGEAKQTMSATRLAVRLPSMSTSIGNTECSEIRSVRETRGVKPFRGRLFTTTSFPQCVPTANGYRTIQVSPAGISLTRMTPAGARSTWMATPSARDAARFGTNPKARSRGSWLRWVNARGNRPRSAVDAVLQRDNAKWIDRLADYSPSRRHSGRHR